MAVLGFHVVVTLIALTVFTKLKARFSFCHYLVLKGLYYFTPPSTYELREISGKRFPEKKRRKNIDDTEPFNVPKDSEFRVLRLPLQAVSLDGVPFFDTLCFVFDYLIFAVMVFAISETFVHFFPENRDTNVSIVWLFIAAAFMLQALVKLTASNIGSVEVSDERNLIFSFCAISFLFCTIFTMWCDKITDIEFNEGYKNFTKIVSNFLKEQELYAISNYEAKSPILLYIFLSVMFSAISSMMLFPSLRYATMYIQAVGNVGKLKQLLIHFTFFLPLFILSMFTKPVKEQFVSERFPWITESRYEVSRIILIIVWSLLRVIVAKPHLQAFLSTAQQKVIALRKESGSIKSDQLQKMIIRYAQYFCAAALQYYVPVFLTLVVSLILKNLGDIDLIRAHTAAIEPEDISNLASLKILLNFSAQKAFWSYCVVMLLIVNVTLTVFGTIYSYNFVNS